MPWEKSFDVSKTLDAAMQLFWEQGFQRTSMQDLIKTMGINPGSIYGTFGNKRELFIGALRFYQLRLNSWFSELASANSPRQAILTVFQTILKEKQENPGQCSGCLLVNTALEVAPHDTEISKLITEGFNSLNDFYRKQVLKGQSGGEINPALDVGVVVDSLVAMTLGLRVTMRLPQETNEITNVIRQVDLMLV